MKRNTFIRQTASGLALAAALMFSAATPATAQERGELIEQPDRPIAEGDLFTFGDSLSDNGNILGTADGVLSTLRLYPVLDLLRVDTTRITEYYKGRFSNGYIWTDHLSHYLSGQLQARNPGIVGPFHVTDTPRNFAHGGAVVSGGVLLSSAEPGLETFAPAFIPPLKLESQVNHFRNHKTLRREGWFKWRWRNVFSVNSGSFASVSIGGNDYRSGVTDVNGLVNGTVKSLGKIRDRGINQFFVLAVPDITFTPLIRGALAEGTLNGTSFGQAEFDALSDRISRHNSSLSNSLTNFSIDRNAEVYFVRADRLLAMGFSNPGSLGFENVTSDCVTDRLFGSACKDTTLFWDPFHPTWKAHQLIAELAIVTMIDAKQGNISGFARSSALGEQALMNNQLLGARFDAFQSASPTQPLTSLALTVNSAHSGLGYSKNSVTFGDNLTLSGYGYFDGQLNGVHRQDSVVGLSVTPVGESLDFQGGEWIASIGTDVYFGDRFMAGALYSSARKADEIFATNRDNELESISVYGAMKNNNLFTSVTYQDQTAQQETSRFSGANFIGTISSNSASRARTVRLDNTLDLPTRDFDLSLVTKAAYSRHNHDGFISGSRNGLIENTIPDRTFSAMVGYIGAEVSKSLSVTERLNASLTFEGGMMATSSSDIGFTPVLDDTLAANPDFNAVGFADPIGSFGNTATYTSLRATLSSDDGLSFATEFNNLSTEFGDQQVARLHATYSF